MGQNQKYNMWSHEWQEGSYPWNVLQVKWASKKASQTHLKYT